MRKFLLLCLLVLLPTGLPQAGSDLPQGFVALRDVDPTIVQDIRYHGSHNFLGRPVMGYGAPECILTVQAAQALKAVQQELAPMGLGLKVYDGYRPQRAVNDFVAWSKKPADQSTKAEFYPNVNKKDFFDLGYVAKKSGHSRGSTVDVTIIPLPAPAAAAGGAYTPGQPLAACTDAYGKRFDDGSIDMGTGFDCMDVLSHPGTDKVSSQARANRMLLRQLMDKHGFKPYEFEWWHFTLKNEPFPETFFDFPVSAR